MTGHTYPDHFYADALANNQQPTGAYDARKLRDETIAIAQSQDRDNDCLVSILAAWRAVRKQQDDVYARLVKLAERQPLPDQYDLKQGEPNAYREALNNIGVITHENPPKWSPEWAKANSSLHWVNPEPQVVCASTQFRELAEADAWDKIAQFELTTCAGQPSTAPNRYVRWFEWDAAPHQKSVGSQHPMQAEAIRDHDERLSGPEDVL